MTEYDIIENRGCDGEEQEILLDILNKVLPYVVTVPAVKLEFHISDIGHERIGMMDNFALKVKKNAHKMGATWSAIFEFGRKQLIIRHRLGET